MAEEQVIQQEAPPDISSQLQEAMWGEKPIQPEGGSGGQQPEKQIVATPTVTNEEIVDPKEWLKREFEVEDAQVIKDQLAELKTLREKATTPQEIKFANELSEKVYKALQEEGGIDKVYTHLDEKRRLDKLTAADVSKTAEEVIKFSMYQKNKTLSSDDIDFLYNKKYSLPAQPEREVADTDEEFNQKVSQWESKVNEIKREIEIEAKMALPELQKMKSELVFPDIQPKQQQAAQPTPEELAESKKQLETFLGAATKTVNEFPGFSTTVKEKDFELAVNYGLSTDEKSFIESKMKLFAEKNFNANALFADAWLNEDKKTINIAKMTEDLSRLYFSDKVATKYATEGANQRLEQYLKEKKNINLNGGNNGVFNPDDKTVSEQLQEKVWA